MEFPSFSKGNVIFIVAVDRASRAGLNGSLPFSLFGFIFILFLFFGVKYYTQLHGNHKNFIIKGVREFFPKSLFEPLVQELNFV